jgi:branched-chain amino acid transport system substrate-binding protein
MRLGLGLGMAACLLVGCGKEDEEGIPLGAVRSLTGDYAGGGPMLETIQAAIDVINEAGGVHDKPLTLVVGDDGSDHERTAEAAQSVIDQGVTAIVGSGDSTGTMAMAEITVPAGVPSMSGEATSPALTTHEDDGFLFRTIPSDALQGRLLAQRARAQGYERAAVIHSPGPYGEGMAESFGTAFTERGGTMTATVVYVEEQPSYVDALTEVLADQPEVVLLSGYIIDAAQIVRDYNTSFADRPVAWQFSDSVVSPDFQTLVGANGFSFPHEGSAPSGEGPAYDAFLRMNPTAPYPTFYTNNFDAVFLFALAMEAAGSLDGSAIRDALPGVSSGGTRFGPDQYADAVAAIRAGEDIDYVGASGEVDFDEHGDVIGPYFIWKVENDEVVTVEEGVVPE